MSHRWLPVRKLEQAVPGFMATWPGTAPTNRDPEWPECLTPTKRDRHGSAANLRRAPDRPGYLVCVFVAGVAMAAAGGSDPLACTGSSSCSSARASAPSSCAPSTIPSPTPERLSDYYDDPIKVGIVLTMIWAIAGMFMGVWVAAQLAWPDLTFDAGWSSYGRLRPLHTSGVIFGFGGNGLIATASTSSSAPAARGSPTSSARGSC